MLPARIITDTLNPTPDERIAAFKWEAALRGWTWDETVSEAAPEADGAVVRFDGEAVWLTTEAEAHSVQVSTEECEVFTFGQDTDGNPVRWCLVLC